MNSRRRKSKRITGLLLFIAVTAIAVPLIMLRFSASESAPPRVHEVPASLPRLAWERLDANELSQARTFTVIDGRLYILDRSLGHVVVLARDSVGWRGEAVISGKGGGPGELRSPAAIAALADQSGIAVLETDGRVTSFLVSGELLGVERWTFPCQMVEPALAFGTRGRRFVAGSCRDLSPSRDTIFAVVSAGDPGLPMHVVAHTPKMAADMSWGTVYSMEHLLSDGPDAVIFATGLDDCLYLIPKSSPAATADIRCGITDGHFSSPPPRELEERNREARRRGGVRGARAFEWPDTLPSFLGVADAGGGLVLVRPISADSLIVVPEGGPFTDENVRLVAPLDGFVGCTAGVCLWLDADESRIAVLHANSGGIVRE